MPLTADSKQTHNLREEYDLFTDWDLSLRLSSLLDSILFLSIYLSDGLSLNKRVSNLTSL
jgi:hypothetical protein